MVVESEKGDSAGAGAGAEADVEGVALGANREMDGTAGEVLVVFKLRPPNGEEEGAGWAPCEVDGSKMDFRLPWESVVGFKLSPPKGLADAEAPWP